MCFSVENVSIVFKYTIWRTFARTLCTPIYRKHLQILERDTHDTFVPLKSGHHIFETKTNYLSPFPQCLMVFVSRRVCVRASVSSAYAKRSRAKIPNANRTQNADDVCARRALSAMRDRAHRESHRRRSSRQFINVHRMTCAPDRASRTAIY